MNFFGDKRRDKKEYTPMLREKAKLQKKNNDYYYTVSKKIHEIQQLQHEQELMEQGLTKENSQNQPRITLYFRDSWKYYNMSAENICFIIKTDRFTMQYDIIPCIS